MKKFLAIYLPVWPVAVALRKLPADPEHRAWLFAAHSGQQLVVKRFCRAAEAAGVEEDMPLPLARALIPQARVENYEPLRDLRALYRLARWAVRFTPFAGLDSDLLEAFRQRRLLHTEREYWGLLLDISGAERVHKGTDNLARRLAEKFKRWGIEARIAIAGTIGAAWALSRYGPPLTLFSPAGIADLLAPLPAAALRLPQAAVTALAQLGINTVGQLHGLPREMLPERFGPELLVRLDQALGRREESFRAVQAPQQFSARRLFDTPLTQQGQIVKVLLQLLEQVMQQLNRHRKKAGYFILRLQGIDSEYRNRTLLKRISLISATESFAHAAGVLQPIIEQLEMPHGIYGFGVVACNTTSVAELQADFTRPAAADAGRAQGELLNHLIVRLGPEHISRIRFNASYLPEHSFTYEEIKSQRRPETHGTALAIRSLARARPSLIFAAPEPIDVIAMLPDKPPSQLTWKGKRRRIVSASGPERIDHEWWGEELGAEIEGREYFKVQDETGLWLWLFRERQSRRWFVQGVWA